MRKPRVWRFGRIRIFSRRAFQRATLWAALMAQVSVGLPIDVIARAGEQQARPAPAQAAPSPQTPPPAAPVHVNRTVPKVTPPGARPTFSAEPGDAEITNARIFGEPLVAIGRGTLRGENHALADAVTRYLDARNPENVLPFLGFLKTYPDSPWRASLLLNLGLVYRHTGYFLRALDVWEQAWLATKTGTDAKARAVADRAVGELFALNARLGRFERLDALFAETKDRVVSGPATEQITAAREGLWMMRNTPEKAFLCGPLAVDQVLAASRAGYVRDEKILQAKSTQQGTSLAQMQKLAADLNLPLQMAKRASGAPVLLPAVMHWKAGHFAALIREADGKFLVRDPTFGDELWISRTALDEEATGYMLVKPQTWPDGWHTVDQAEGEQVWGKGQTDGNDPDQTHDDDEQAGGDGGDGNNSGNDGDDDPGDNASDDGDDPDADNQNDDNQDDDPTKDSDDDSCGMPRYSIHLMVVGLHLEDTPVGYRPPHGSSVKFVATYNQREAHQPQSFAFSSLGPKWTFKWLSYIEDDPSNPSATAYLAARGGGRDIYQNFNPATQTYQPDKRLQAVLVRTSSTPIRYERRLPGGAVEVFAQADGAATFPRRVFLTAVRERRGNTTTFSYDGQLRLIAVTDPLGQVTTLNYDEPTDSHKITRVSDPFGRFASFDYDGAGRLAHITDMLGMQSGFTYDGGDFITALTTPYGITHFVKGENGQDRWLETTDPLGGRERVEYKMNAPVPVSEPAVRVPAGVGVVNNFLNYRNTFYWGKRQMAMAPHDPASAHVYHWLHTSGPLNQTSGVLESERRPLEGRIWYRYPGQSIAYSEGTSRHRTAVARVLDDGTTQVWRREYNDQGQVTKYTDPLGRETTFTFAANGIDLQEVRQTTGGASDVLSTFSNYTAQHLPRTITDAAGQTTTLTYNADGQMLTVTNARLETTSYDYTVDGYLHTITGSITGAVTTYGYDGFGRLHSITRSDGYTRVIDYDAMNRRTRVTFPDGTFVQKTFDRLDVAERRDRLGRVTRIYHDALRRIVAVRDPLDRVLTEQWCACGSLEAVIDPNGHKTTWDRDLQGRILHETRADGTTAFTYEYETTTSRVTRKTDAKGQVAHFAYNTDNTLQATSFTNTAISTPAISYTYDTVHDRLLTMTDGTGVTTYAYKPFGGMGASRLASVDGPLANDTVTYTYDELGRVTARLVNGVGRTRTYDAMGRVATEVNPLGTFTYSYDGPTNLLTSIAYPNGQLSEYSYFDVLGDRRLKQIHHKYPGGGTLEKFDYTYDAAGNVQTWQQQADASPAVEWRYTYDDVDRLLAASESTTSSPASVVKRYAYRYDRADNRASEQIDDNVLGAAYDAGNRLTSHTPSGSLRFAGTVSEPATVSIGGAPAAVSADNHFEGEAPVPSGTSVVSVTATDASGNTQTNQYQVTNSGTGRTFASDADGNLTSDGVRTFEWNALNQLVAVSVGTHRTEVTYDGLGRRVRMVEKESGVVQQDTSLVWCGLSICEERDTTSGTITRRVLGEGEQINGVAMFLVSDHLASVRALTNNAGALVGRFDFDPWGRRTVVAGTASAVPSYTGYAEHPESGLLLSVYRPYDPALGRFITEDPAGFAAGPNLFAYVGGRPTTSRDQFGLSPKKPPVPVPGGGEDNDWKWNPNPFNSRGGSFGPKKPIPGQSQPSASYDPEGHWDVDDGLGNRQRYDDDGNPITADQAHGKAMCDGNCQRNFTLVPIVIGGVYVGYKVAEAVYCFPLVFLTP